LPIPLSTSDQREGDLPVLEKANFPPDWSFNTSHVRESEFNEKDLNHSIISGQSIAFENEALLNSSSISATLKNPANNDDAASWIKMHAASAISVDDFEDIVDNLKEDGKISKEQ